MTGTARNIRVRGLERSFEGVRALAGVDFDIRPGRITAYLGPNGAGKTTTIKIMLGFVRPDAGSADLGGMTIGYVPDQPRFAPWIKGRALIDLTAGTFGVPKDAAWAGLERRAAELRFELRDLERRPAAYSSGNMKKMAYLQNLILDPDLFIADEPFTALDPASISTVREMFLKMRSRGRTVFLSSHMLSEMARLADDVVVIKRGRIAAVFSPGPDGSTDLEKEFLRLTDEERPEEGLR